MWWKDKGDAPRPKRRGPKRGEREGGVCPEDVPFAVSLVSKVRTVTRMDWIVGDRSSKKV